MEKVSREVVKLLIESPLAVSIAKMSASMKSSGEMGGCDEMMLQISMEKSVQQRCVCMCVC